MPASGDRNWRIRSPTNGGAKPEELLRRPTRQTAEQVDEGKVARAYECKGNDTAVFAPLKDG